MIVPFSLDPVLDAVQQPLLELELIQPRPQGLSSAPGANEERPWLSLVMCLPESGR